MVTERIEVDLDEIYDEVPEGEVLDDATIQQTISEEQATNDSKEAEEDTDSQDSSRHDAFKEAADSLSQEPEPDVVKRSDFEKAFNNLQNTLKAELAQIKAENANTSTEPKSADELALERLLAEGDNPATPEEVAVTRARLNAYKQQIEKEQNEQSIPDRLKAIEDGIAAIKSGNTAPPPGVKQWTDSERTHLTNAVMYLSAAAGLNIDLSNATQVSAVMNNIAPGEDVPSAIQQMQNNIAQIKANLGNETQPATNDATNTVAADVSSMGGAATTNDTRVFNTEEDIKLAIANDEIDLADYNKYLAQITA